MGEPGVLYGGDEYAWAGDGEEYCGGCDGGELLVGVCGLCVCGRGVWAGVLLWECVGGGECADGGDGV